MPASATGAQMPKIIGRSQPPQIVPSMIVLNARGAKLEGQKLTLDGISPNAIVFADRPVRSAGHALTAHLLEEWSINAPDSFAKTAPNEARDFSSWALDKARAAGLEVADNRAPGVINVESRHGFLVQSRQR